MILNRISVLILASLSLLTLGLNPVSQGNYFYVPFDNHLSYELYQTRNGTIAHSIEPLDGNNYISRYSLINLDTKDATPIFSDLVSSCDNLNPTFQALHYHAPTDSLVYYCAKNYTLLVLNQQDHTVQDSIHLGSSSYLPIAKLSTDGVNVVILLMDTLFTQNLGNSLLLKVDMQTKKLTTQISFGEPVVAYAAGKNNQTYVATNKIQGTTLITSVYSLNVTQDFFQLNQIANFSTSTASSKVITKLLTLGDYIVVNNGGELKFLNQQGAVVQSAQIQTKPLTNQDDGLSHPAFAAQSSGANLYAIRNYNNFCVYSVANNAIQRKDVSSIYGDFQVAFGNSGDFIFTSDKDGLFFFILEAKKFQPIYQTVSGYIDIILTDTTYTIIRGLYTSYIDQYISGYAFGLKNNTLLKTIDLTSSDKYYYNKDEKIITHMVPDVPSGCSLYHVDMISLKEGKSTSFSTKDPICKAVDPIYARVTDKGNPEVVFRSATTNQYELLGETFGRLSFPATSSIDSLNVNFDKDLALYYLSANQATNQVTASLYAFNPLTKNFSRITTNTLNNRPVENKGFFTVNQSTSVALSNTSFAVINKIDSIYSEENFANNYFFPVTNHHFYGVFV